MTSWIPELSQIDGPRYLAIAKALAADVASGRLPPGTRLPTHRELAYRLRVTVGTVSRAYAEAQRHGLTTGEVGRGTYVRSGDKSGRRPVLALDEARPPDVIDFSVNLPVMGACTQAFADALTQLARVEGLDQLLEYQPDRGLSRHRAAGAKWIERMGIDAPPERVIVTNGAQHGMQAVFAALTRADDVVLTEPFTYPGMTELADHLGIRLQRVAMDRDGLLPDALEEACRLHRPRAVYLMTNLQNPTTAIMPEDRRRAVADIARRHEVFLVEDDVYGFLPKERPPSLAHFAPEITFYITSLSKSVAPGLRLGYVLAPEGHAARIGAVVRSTCRMAGLVTAEIGTRWIEDGTADRVAEFQRQEVWARQEIAGRLLAGVEYDTKPDSFHLWMHLPEPWRADEFAAHARTRNVIVLPAAFFTVGRVHPPQAVRICLGAPRDRDQVEKGLRILADILAQPAQSLPSVI
jgi:DNA-binding transcriptional MocR family regulator